MSKIVKLKDYLAGSCPYGGCEYNISGTGSCSLEEDEFMEFIAEAIESQAVSEFVCTSMKVKENHCEWCGEPMIQVENTVPLGDGETTMVLLECHNPNC